MLPDNQYRHTFALLLPLLLVALSSSCSLLQELPYYRQAVHGHLSLWLHQQPIERLLADDSRASLHAPMLPLSDRERQTLTQVQAARQFAQTHLALPAQDQYRDYVRIAQPFVVYNLIAAPAFATQAKPWCYPLIGCQIYRGYYQQADATTLATQLAQAGLDTWVAGVRAYSTLGWFRDPVVSSFVDLGEAELVGLIFHELAHHQVFIADDTRFNESFATAVELEGLLAWFKARNNTAGYSAALNRIRMQQQLAAAAAATKRRLDKAYTALAQGRADVATSLAIKAAAFAALAEQARRIARQAGDAQAFDGWLAGGLNNAKLALMGQYLADVDAFRHLLYAQGCDYPAFYQAVESLGQLPQAERDTRLQRLKQTAAASSACQP